MASLLEKIQSPKDMKDLTLDELNRLSSEIREFLVEHVARTGGHLSSNLGIVELTVALHLVFDTPRDKLIWDVGHQAYVHKLLTGRRDAFGTLRQKDGISGFPKAAESEYDTFDVGHASNSISLGYGLAKARDLAGEDHRVVCVIGDGSLSGGMAYEAMNNAGKDKTGLIVVLNDNQMSISRSVGSVASHLGRLRTRRAYLKSKQQFKQAVSKHPSLRPLYNVSDYVKDRVKYLLTDGILFEEMGFTYLGPVDGHDISALKEALEQAKLLNEPVLVHVITQKGRGYGPAEQHPENFHGVGVFDPATGEIPHSPCPTYAEVYGKCMARLAEQDNRVVLITAAMTEGTGLTDCVGLKDRFFDVGIAEEHAVSFAAGMARGGRKPYVSIYSTFLQRAYDQIMTDVCLSRLPVVFILDHAGVVGEDGETHQGIFDLAYLSHIPGMTVMAPSCREELEAMIEFSRTFEQPLAIRYPKGQALSLPGLSHDPVKQGESVLAYRSAKQERSRVAILSLGVCLPEALKAAPMLEQRGLQVSVYDMRFASPLNPDFLAKVFAENDLVLTVEDHVHTGGFGMQVGALAKEREFPAAFLSLTLPDRFLPQDSRCHALKEYGLCAGGICAAVCERLKIQENTVPES